MLAGALALGIGTYDSWKFGRDAGLGYSLDELLVIGGVVLIAGRMFVADKRDLPAEKRDQDTEGGPRQ